MLTQKLHQNGSSVTVKIPKNYLRDDSVVVLEKRGQEVVISSQKRSLAPNVDAKFMKMVDEFIGEHEDVLQELAKR